MLRLLVLCLAAVTFVRPVQGEKKRKADAPTQDAITQGCVVVSDIRSHRMGWRVGPGLDALVHNGCGRPISVTVFIAYYDAEGVQFASSSESANMAPVSDWRFRHVPFGEERLARFRSGKVISVSLMPLS